MSQPPNHLLHDQRTRLREQIAKISEHFNVAVGPPEAASPDSQVMPLYLAEEGYLLVREGNEHRITPHVAVRHSESPLRRNGVARVPIDDRVADAMDRLNQVSDFRDARPRVVTPNHLVTITPANGCPADEPMLPNSLSMGRAAGLSEVALLRPPLSAGDAGAGVDVLVVDTGLADDYLTHSWLDDTTGGPRITGAPNVPHRPDRVNLYQGHGTFIAGVLRCVAPKTRVRVSNALRNVGAICEFELGTILLRELNEWERQDGKAGWPDIINFSAGAPTVNTSEPLLGLEEFLRQLDTHPETVLVCAAGNDGERCQPFWPAAHAPDYEKTRAIIAVGALRGDGLGRACFTNYGDWVTVYAPGERLINAFTSGTYRTEHPVTAHCRYYPGEKPDTALYLGCTCVTANPENSEVVFKGIASWSGTSFATPVVVGHIARRMSESAGRTSREAAQQLLGDGVRVIQDVEDKVWLPTLRDAVA